MEKNNYITVTQLTRYLKVRYQTLKIIQEDISILL